MPTPFPTIVARMRPSDSPAASARLRSSLGVPYQVDKRGFCARWRSHHVAGCRTACRRRRVGEGHRFSVTRIYHLDGQGPPRLPGHPLWPCRSRSPRRVLLRLALAPPGVLPSGFPSPWAPGITSFRGCIPTAHPLA